MHEREVSGDVAEGRHLPMEDLVSALEDPDFASAARAEQAEQDAMGGQTLYYVVASYDKPLDAPDMEMARRKLEGVPEAPAILEGWLVCRTEWPA